MVSEETLLQSLMIRRSSTERKKRYLLTLQKKSATETRAFVDSGNMVRESFAMCQVPASFLKELCVGSRALGTAPLTPCYIISLVTYKNTDLYTNIHKSL